MDTRKPPARIAATILHIMLVLWTGAKLMADWIGRSTLVEDAEHAQGILAKGANWLFSTPWWVPALLATALTILLIFYILPKEERRSATRRAGLSPDGERDARPVPPAGSGSEPELPAGKAPQASTGAVAHRSDTTDALPSMETPEEQQANDDLTVFVTDYIICAGCAQLDLQNAIIKEICNNNELDWLASQALLTNYRVNQFGVPFERLWGSFCSSPMKRVPLNELMASILMMDKGYQDFCSQAEQLAKSANLDCQTHNRLSPLWNEWRNKHNKLVKAYKTIKRDRRFPTLFRPGIESPWDREVPPHEAGSENRP